MIAIEFAASSAGPRRVELIAGVAGRLGDATTLGDAVRFEEQEAAARHTATAATMDRAPGPRPALLKHRRRPTNPTEALPLPAPDTSDADLLVTVIAGLDSFVALREGSLSASPPAR